LGSGGFRSALTPEATTPRPRPNAASNTTVPATSAAERTRLLRILDYVKGPEKDAALLQLLAP
jgi:hypothetical protein